LQDGCKQLQQARQYDCLACCLAAKHAPECLHEFLLIPNTSEVKWMFINKGHNGTYAC
jgi:hypothetical protein